MTNKVPYMTPEAIEQDAAALLAEYAWARGVVIVPFIPIEDMLEKHLKLGIEFDDTHSPQWGEGRKPRCFYPQLHQELAPTRGGDGAAHNFS